MYFPPPPCSLLWRSCEWHRGRGVCSCWVIHSYLPLFVPAWVCLLLWLQISRHQVSWRLEFSPSSVHLLPALPLGKGPQPGLTAHSLPQWCLGLHLGLLGSWRCRLAVTELSGRYLACWGPPVAPHLWASCYSGDTFSFCPHWPFCHLLSRPGDSALQPHRDPFFFFLSLSWTLGPSSSPFWVARRLHSQASVPFPKPRCWVQSCIHSEGLPFCPCPLAPLSHPEAMAALQCHLSSAPQSAPAQLSPLSSKPAPDVLWQLTIGNSHLPALYLFSWHFTFSPISPPQHGHYISCGAVSDS